MGAAGKFGNNISNIQKEKMRKNFRCLPKNTGSRRLGDRRSIWQRSYAAEDHPIDDVGDATLVFFMGTLRFRELVKKAGTPEIKSLWTDPKRDRDFMRATKEHRVLTLVQEPGSKKKDFGEIGFHQHAHASYLVFPKRLPGDDGNKVVGIKYDLVEEPELSDALSPEQLKKLRAPKAKAGGKPKSAKQSRPAKTFDVRIRRMAVLESVVSVEAASRSEARKKAAAQAEASPFDPSKAKFTTRVAGIK
ncbi:MAG TPA: hypothetical protein VN873_08560 [Candidatus Angelobacter sp.]|nr:hypothetical protein [Candidatus Angelobacter sp.]